MINILVITNGWLTKVSGGEQHILKVTQCWSKKGFKIQYLIPRLGYIYAKDYLSGKAHVIQSPIEREYKNILLIIMLYIYRIIKAVFVTFEDKPNVIITSSHFLYDVLPGIILCIKYKSTLIVYVHHLVAYSRKINSLRNLLSILNELISLFFIKLFANLIFVVNPNVRKYLLEMGFNQAQISLTSNGIDISNIESVNVNSKKYECCFCGRIVSQKGVFDLIEIWKKVVKEFPNVKLVIVGDGEESIALHGKIKKFGLSKNISLVGFLDEYKKIKILKSSKILLLPSYEEGWGIVIGEALVAELPVICYDLPQINIIWGNNVVWIPKGDKSSFALEIIKLLENEYLRKKIAIRGKQFVKKRYSWDKIANKELMWIIRGV